MICYKRLLELSAVALIASVVTALASTTFDRLRVNSIAEINGTNMVNVDYYYGATKIANKNMTMKSFYNDFQKLCPEITFDSSIAQ